MIAPFPWVMSTTNIRRSQAGFPFRQSSGAKVRALYATAPMRVGQVPIFDYPDAGPLHTELAAPSRQRLYGAQNGVFSSTELAEVPALQQAKSTLDQALYVIAGRL